MPVNMIIVSKPSLSFSAAHFLQVPGKCSRLHGHNYRVKAGVVGQLDESGMIVDFGWLCERIREICSRIDHKLLLPAKSAEMRIEKRDGEVRVILEGREYLFPEEDVVLLPLKATSAELLARYIYEELSKVVDGLSFVEVEETEGSSARYPGGGVRL